MFLKHRTSFGSALAVAAVMQLILLSLVYYINCGLTGPVTSVGSYCERWFPPVSAHVVARLLTTLATPGIYIVPHFFLPAPVSGLPGEWAWILVVAFANVVFWTVCLGTVFMPLGVIARGMQQPARPGS